jgi:hypothetical protein
MPLQPPDAGMPTKSPPARTCSAVPGLVATLRSKLTALAGKPGSRFATKVVRVGSQPVTRASVPMIQGTTAGISIWMVTVSPSGTSACQVWVMWLSRMGLPSAPTSSSP